MDIEIREVGKFADVTIEINDMVCYVGMLNQRERLELINTLSDAASVLSSFTTTDE